jgi:hypothetical protein
MFRARVKISNKSQNLYSSFYYYYFLGDWLLQYIVGINLVCAKSDSQLYDKWIFTWNFCPANPQLTRKRQYHKTVILASKFTRVKLHQCVVFVLNSSQLSYFINNRSCASSKNICLIPQENVRRQRSQLRLQPASFLHQARCVLH